MLKNLSLKAKITGAITIVAALGAIAVLVIILLAGNTRSPNTDNTNSGDPDSSQVGDNGTDDTDLASLIAALPSQTALNEIHSLLSGFWTSDNKFVGFTYVDGAPAIEYGLFATSFGLRGKITDARAVNATEAQFTILIPATPATEMDEARPEKTVTVSIDISNFDNNRLNIQTPELESGQWFTYEFGGATLEEAYDN